MSIKSGLACVLGSALCAWGPNAAASGFVQNGGFESTTLTAPGNPAGVIAPWTSSSFDYLWFPGTADVSPSFNYGALWGPGNGAANGLPATSPAGGNFLEQDPYYNTPLTQTITGLTPNARYKLSFYWAAATWTGALLAPTTRDWQVSLGTETYSTASVTVPAQGFSGWMLQTFTYTPANATEVLSFLSQGVGDPPVALLDGVSLEAVPEPASWALMIIGVAGLGAAARSRRRAGAAAAP